MGQVTVTGGPFNDGQASPNPLPGTWSFVPQAALSFTGDNGNLGQNGTLGGFPNIPYGSTLGPAVAAAPGCFTAQLTDGGYWFTLRTPVVFISQAVTINSAEGASQTIESILAG